MSKCYRKDFFFQPDTYTFKDGKKQKSVNYLPWYSDDCSRLKSIQSATQVIDSQEITEGHKDNINPFPCMVL